MVITLSSTLMGIEIGRQQTISTISKKSRYRPDSISLAREVDVKSVRRYFEIFHGIQEDYRKNRKNKL